MAVCAVHQDNLSILQQPAPAGAVWADLEMVTPILCFDSAEHWFPVAVEESVWPYGYLWSNEQKSWTKNGSTTVKCLDFPADMVSPDFPPVGYHRAVRDQFLWWHLFGLWYLYNPKEYAWRGQHEGDWEFVAIATADQAGDEPVLVYGSQHSSGVGRVAWKCELSTSRPVIYVAVGSHANYLGRTHTALDRADGQGRVMATIEWREFGLWANWRGKWGNSDNSPGPLSTRMLWRAPALTYAQGK